MKIRKAARALRKGYTVFRRAGDSRDVKRYLACDYKNRVFIEAKNHAAGTSESEPPTMEDFESTAWEIED
jgi:hypothetical protein